MRTFQKLQSFHLACTPSRFWFVSRHGGRVPSATTIQAMRTLIDGPVSSRESCIQMEIY